MCERYLIQGSHILHVFLRCIQIGLRLIDFYGHLFDGGTMTLTNNGLETGKRSDTTGDRTAFLVLSVHSAQSSNCVAQDRLYGDCRIARKIDWLSPSNSVQTFR